MSPTLALDTATDLASIAVGDGATVLAEVTLGARRHAAALVPAIEEAVRLAGTTLNAIDRVLLGDGPGSFTGLRIGVATVQGLVRARPAITVATAPSMVAAAWSVARMVDGPVAVAYDALRGDVFGAVYRFPAGGLEVVLPPSLTTVEAMAQSCPVVPVVVVGDGAVAQAGAARAWTGRDPLPPPLGAPRAAGFLALDSVPGALRRVDDIATFEPDYGRPAEAQARWERAHGRPLPDAPGHSR